MATLNNFGIPEDFNGILHPKIKNLWKVTFSAFGDGTSREVSFQAITITRPSLNFEEIQLDRYNSKAWVAGKHTFEPMTITLEDDITSLAAKQIQAQMEHQQYLIGAGGSFLGKGTEGSKYKFATKLEQLDGSGYDTDSTSAIETWYMEGCWIQNVDYGDLDYAASEAVQITLTVRYDHAHQIFGDYSGPGNATGGHKS